VTVPVRTPVYMDNHATTPVDARVLEAMLPYFSDRFGNAASTHIFGWEAREAVEEARRQLAALINATPQEIIFTSGATESDNLAIKGVAYANRNRGRHLVTCLTEHNAVLDCMKKLQRQGYEVTYLGVDGYGMIDLQQLAEAIRPDTILISLMAANNEIGTIHPVAEIGRIAREKEVLFHCDGAQAVGRIPTDVDAMNVDLLSISAHKIYGPKGIGALYIRRRPEVKLFSLIDGGGHERGLRSGTLNVPGCVGLGAACSIAAEEIEGGAPEVRRLRDRLHDQITSRLDRVRLNGHPIERLSGNLNLAIEGIDAEALLMNLRDIALSTGSACTSATPEPSHVLQAIGLSDDLAYGSVRFGLGRFNTEAEVDYVVDRLVESVTLVRGMSDKSVHEISSQGSG
jgi:cysteine desulfurase